jgi:hypothetical protein
MLERLLESWLVRVEDHRGHGLKLSKHSHVLLLGKKELRNDLGALLVGNSATVQ